MRAILQRVKQASVIVDGDIVGKIGPGIVALVGIMRDDNTEDTKWLVNKILGLRLWPDDSGRMWKKSVTALDYEVLVVSQFTLHAVFKGTKPDYHFASESPSRVGRSSRLHDGSCRWPGCEGSALLTRVLDVVPTCCMPRLRVCFLFVQWTTKPRTACMTRSLTARRALTKRTRCKRASSPP